MAAEEWRCNSCQKQAFVSLSILQDNPVDRWDAAADHHRELSPDCKDPHIVFVRDEGQQWLLDHQNDVYGLAAV